MHGLHRDNGTENGNYNLGFRVVFTKVLWLFSMSCAP